VEKRQRRLEVLFPDIVNHLNLGDAELRIDENYFGQITSAGGPDFVSYRTGQVSVRLDSNEPSSGGATGLW
jgi:hypothetical protein